MEKSYRVLFLRTTDLVLVVSRIDQRVVGQREGAAVDRAIKRRRIPALQVRADATVDQQRIAGEDAPHSEKRHEIAVVGIRVHGRKERLEGERTDLQQPIEGWPVDYR